VSAIFYRFLWTALLGAVLAPAISAEPVLVATLPVGPQPVGVAMSPRSHRAYVADSSGAVFIVDGAALRLMGTVALGGRPSAVAVDPRTDKIYVGQADAASPALSVIPGAGGTASPVLPSGRAVAALAVHPVGARLFVGDAAAPEVVMLDTTRDAVLGVIHVSGPVLALGVNQSTNRLYVSVSGAQQGVDVVELGTMALTHVPLPDGPPRRLVVDPHNDRVYGDRAQPPLLLAMTGPQAMEAGSMPLTGPAMGLGLDSQTGRVYVCHGELRQLTVVDGPAMTPLTTPAMTDRYEAIVVDPQLKPAQIYLVGPSGMLAIMRDS
jgi:DNA-binding beta-propeller fold protein YncE